MEQRKQLVRFFSFATVDVYLLKVNKGNARPLCEISSKLIMKTPKDTDVVDVVVVSLLLTLNRVCTLFWCFHCSP